MTDALTPWGPLPRSFSALPAGGSTLSAERGARWARLRIDYARLPLLPQGEDGADPLRDVGALLLAGHDHALAEAERYVVEGHTMRTGEVIEWDDIDDLTTRARWVAALDAATTAGFAPPAPDGFWASFLTWRTPLGMARLAERRQRARKS